ncbi:MAG: hypothetical protein Q8M10_03025 [Methylotenera sp.]|uniref:hypothetical protein n=1 Tax=Methylotenera sp. TaxID=2051956 RepID=UPI002730FA27|nr:hypothetical protein [Methylotenera sp.]MDP1522103.1 hypothetical protein [Methylotenera sp.]
MFKSKLAVIGILVGALLSSNSAMADGIAGKDASEGSDKCLSLDGVSYCLNDPIGKFLQSGSKVAKDTLTYKNHIFAHSSDVMIGSLSQSTAIDSMTKINCGMLNSGMSIPVSSEKGSKDAITLTYRPVPLNSTYTQYYLSDITFFRPGDFSPSEANVFYENVKSKLSGNVVITTEQSFNNLPKAKLNWLSAHKGIIDNLEIVKIKSNYVIYEDESSLQLVRGRNGFQGLGIAATLHIEPYGKYKKLSADQLKTILPSCKGSANTSY